MQWFAVAVGGAIGSVLRWVVSMLLPGQAFPYGTSVINLSGSWALGWLYGRVGEAGKRSALYRGAASGFLGGYTTMSAFGLEAWTMFAEGRWPALIAYTAVSALAGPLLAAAGIRAGKRYRQKREAALAE